MPAVLNQLDEDGIPVIEVKGRLSLDDLDPFQDLLDSLNRGTARAYVVDLLDCPFLASRVFPALLRASQTMEAANRTLYIACPDDLYRILEVLRLTEHLAVKPTREDCLEAARKAS